MGERSFSISSLEKFSGPKHQIDVVYFGIIHKQQNIMKIKISHKEAFKIKKELYKGFTKSLLLNPQDCQNSG